MFRDTKEALQRLEKQLLEEEEQEKTAPCYEQDPPEEEDLYIEEYCEESQETEDRGISTLATLAFILLSAILLVLGVFLLRMGGYL